MAADADRLARFQREAEMLAALNHSNIAHIYGIAEAEGVRALVMELVEGPTLAERVARGPLPLDEVLAAARQIAEALEAAHDRGIIHRDLKPANIKLTPDGVVKVLDFGLAKALEAAGGDQAVVNAPTITSPAMTRAGIILGTAAYMSPEQARGRTVDTRTDVWAFGCVMYEMLTARGPFEGDTITFWSPDSRHIGFVVGYTLKRIPADGGPVQELAFPAGHGGAWGPDDTILYTTGAGPIPRTSASGGQPTEVTTLPGTDWAHTWPSFLPDGRHFVFTAKHWTSTAESSKQGVYIGSLTQPTESTRLLPDLTSALYAPPGFIVFVREGQLMAIPFDAGSRRETGEPIALDEAVAIDNTHYLAGVSAAATGTLAIRPPPTAPLTAWGTFVAELRLVDRGGGNAMPIGGFHPFSDSLALSPDGHRVAAGLQDARAGTAAMWQFDVQSGAVFQSRPHASGWGHLSGRRIAQCSPMRVSLLR